ncbi:hypothetical protein NFI96_030325 [Prochilodus magdalenae]|nr:hypothetical protein NFI96_030325 [Prochilodus magdalenae]
MTVWYDTTAVFGDGDVVLRTVVVTVCVHVVLRGAAVCQWCCTNRRTHGGTTARWMSVVVMLGQSELTLQQALHQSVFMPCATPSPSMPHCWDQHSKLLPSVAGITASKVATWSVEEVTGFIQGLPGCREQARTFREELEHPHTVPADGAVCVEVEGHQVFWTCDDKPFILALTTVPPHTDSLGVSTKTKAGLVTEDDPLPF